MVVVWHEMTCHTTQIVRKGPTTMIRFARVRTALAALILGSAVALPLTHGMAPQAVHAAGSNPILTSLVGTWHNADPATRGVRVLKITYDSFWHHDNIQTWARCNPEDCYWGSQSFDAAPSAPVGPCYWFNMSSLRQCLTLQRQGNQLLVTQQTDGFLWDNRPTTFAHYTFLPGA
jgi:hypothetical protein